VSRRLKLATVEMGLLDLFLVYQYGAAFEPDWASLQGNPLVDTFTVVSKEVMDHALHGFTRPLVQKLGLAPASCLLKIPPANRECEHRVECPFYDRTECTPTSKKLPNCFQPSGVEGDDARQLGYAVVTLWREGVFIVVVQEASSI